jgi:hypothetical protein
MTRCHIARIQGLSVPTGQLAFTDTDIPAYATGLAHYIEGALYGPPDGVGSVWDAIRQSVTSGSARFRLRRNVSPSDLYRINPKPVTELSVYHSHSVVLFQHKLTNTEAGIAVGTIVYINGEACLVDLLPAANQFQVSARGFGGSDATPHPTSSDVYLSIPALEGRIVEISKIDELDPVGGAAAETVIFRGQIDAEPSGGLFGPVISCKSSFPLAKLNRFPRVREGFPLIVRGNVAGLDLTIPREFDVATGAERPPRGSTDGGYLLHTQTETVWPVAWDGTVWGDAPSGPPSIGPGLPEQVQDNAEASDALKLSHILYADSRLQYPPFGHEPIGGGAFVPSDNPFVIILNILLSTYSGTNEDAGDKFLYDRGAHIDRLTGIEQSGGLYPNFAFGVDRLYVDVPAFEVAIEETAEIHARQILARRDKAGKHPEYHPANCDPDRLVNRRQPCGRLGAPQNRRHLPGPVYHHDRYDRPGQAGFVEASNSGPGD